VKLLKKSTLPGMVQSYYREQVILQIAVEEGIKASTSTKNQISSAQFMSNGKMLQERN